MLAVCAFAILSAAWIAVLHLIRAQGVIITGDEPHYLVEGVSITRFHTLDMNPGYNFALTHHIIYPWTAQPGPHLAAVIGQSIWRHGLYLPFHAIGLSALLSIPLLAGTTTAVVALVLVLTALTVGLVHLAGQVSAVRSPWRIAIAGLFLAPAFMLAATQVYPDLISGLVIAIVIMTMAVIEVRKECSWTQIWIVSISLVMLPWLDQKNIFFPVPLMAAFLISCGKAKLPARGLRSVIIPLLISLAGLLVLNSYAFGHLLGGPQQIELISRNTWTRAVALLIDRRQGLFVQAPTALLGIAGMWAMRKRLPISVLTAASIVLVTIYGNATQPASFGGYSFVGRFQWPTLPLLVTFAGLYLLELWGVRRTAAIVVTVVTAGLYVVQFAPILRREHIYYNLSGWDPLTYTGWWGGLDPSPILGYIGRDVIGYPRVAWGITCLVMLGSFLVYCLVQLVNRPSRLRIPIVCALLGGVAITFPMTLSSAALPPVFVGPGVTVPLAPVRICDTRPGNPSALNGDALQCSAGMSGKRLTPNGTLTFAVAGRFGVPASGVTAVMLNVTSFGLSAAGSFTLFPGGQSPPSTSNLDFAAGQVLSSLAEVGVGVGGTVSLYSTSTSDAMIDLEGYVTTTPQNGGGLYNPMASPTRICDTRGSNASGLAGNATQCNTDTAQGSPDRLVGPSNPLTVTVSGHGGVPSTGVSAVELNIAVANQHGPGYVSVFPTGQPLPNTANVSFSGGQPASNQVFVPVSGAGQVNVYASVPTDLMIDVSGYTTNSGGITGSKFTPEIAPVRICDTRGSNPSGLVHPYTQCNPNTTEGNPDTPFGPGTTRTIQVSGLGYVPVGAQAVVLNVTEVSATAPGYLSITSKGQSPATPEVVLPVGGIASNLIVAPLSKLGTIDVFNFSTGTTNLAVDVVGWYIPPQS